MANVDPVLDQEIAANNDLEAVFCFLMQVKEDFDEKEIEGLFVGVKYGDTWGCSGTREAIEVLRTDKRVLRLEADSSPVEEDYESTQDD